MEVFMKEKTTVAQKLQKFGAFLAGMVIPNIGAFIGFGLITAFFLSTGWTPNEELAKLISPILNNLLPILIAYTGGKMVGGQRGAVLGAFVTLGAIVAVEGTPMFLAAMILGPFSGLVISKFDKFIDGKVPGGFEMIVNNFSLGIIGAILCCFAYLVFGPLMHAVSAALTSGVNWMLDHNILPLSHIFVEPAKVLFLNNALDHGIFGPIGYDQVKQFGHSALFMLVPNPGPGLGLLLAYWFFGKGEMEEAAPGMIIIHFFGGIHEVYFPYVLSNPVTILGMIAAGIVGTGTLTLFDAGTVATPSPGSIFSVIALTPKDSMIAVLLAVVLSAAVSLALNSIFVRIQVRRGGDMTMGESVIPAEAMGSSAARNDVVNDIDAGVAGLDLTNVRKIAVCCDAGMGSSAMSAQALKKKIKAAGLPIEVTNYAIARIPADVDLIITHEKLTGTAKAAQPGKQHLSISNYMKAPEYDELTEALIKVELAGNRKAAPAPAPQPQQPEESLARRRTAGGRMVDLRTIDKIMFVCDAGMGSSAMGAVVLQNMLEANGLANIRVAHCKIVEIPADSRYIVCPKEFAVQIADCMPDSRIIAIDNIMDAPEYKQITEEFLQARVNSNILTGESDDYHGGVLIKKNIRTNLPSVTKEEAIRAIGNALVETGYVTEKYVDGMIAKEDVFNTAIGNSLAIPHGIESVIGEIRNSGLAIFTYPDGIDWGEGETVKLVIAVASAGDSHVETLGKIAGACESEEAVEDILKMSVDEIYDLFA